MRLEFPQASGRVFTGTIDNGLAIVADIRRHYNRDGHNGPSPQERGLPHSASYGIGARRESRPAEPVRSERPSRSDPVPPRPEHDLTAQGSMLERLSDYYRAAGISAIGFGCRYERECRATAARFTTAKESYVGPKYEAGARPRLVFLSLDSGSASDVADAKTLAAVRRQTLEEDVGRLPHGKHWYLTHELAFALLRPFYPDLTIADSRLYFAHVNSAKCCANNPQRAQASDVLFDNCRAFLPGELAILSPDVIVSQGQAARSVITRAMTVRDHARHERIRPSSSLND